MTVPATEIIPEFQRGWDGALMAVRIWHASQAKRALIQARRSRFPKNLEREAEVHQKSALMIATLNPDDVLANAVTFGHQEPSEGPSMAF